MLKQKKRTTNRPFLDGDVLMLVGEQWVLASTAGAEDATKFGVWLDNQIILDMRLPTSCIVPGMCWSSAPCASKRQRDPKDGDERPHSYSEEDQENDRPPAHNKNPPINSGSRRRNLFL